MQAQVDWLHFLATQGAPVSRPVPSQQGRLAEQLSINASLVAAVCYEHVPGERQPVPTLTAAQWQGWGQGGGKLHTLSMRYPPPQPFGPIEHWHTSAHRDRQAIPPEQTRVLEKFDALQQYLQTLPIERHVYGLLHGDVQANNLCLDRGIFWVIDFDNCAYHWFLLDIATSLYFSLWERPANQSNAAFAEFVLENLVIGYARECELDVTWVKRLPVFLKLVEMNIYVAINAYHQVAVRGNLEALPPKHRALLSRYRYQIEHDVPYLESAYNPWT